MVAHLDHIKHGGEEMIVTEFYENNTLCLINFSNSIVTILKCRLKIEMYCIIKCSIISSPLTVLTISLSEIIGDSFEVQIYKMQKIIERKYGNIFSYSYTYIIAALVKCASQVTLYGSNINTVAHRSTGSTFYFEIANKWRTVGRRRIYLVRIFRPMC